MRKYIKRFLINTIAEAVLLAGQDKKNYEDFAKYARLQSIRDSYHALKPYIKQSLIFNDRASLWDYALQHILDDGLLIELGVFRAESLNYFARAVQKREIYGFDSFVGLSEDWTGLGAPAGSAFNIMGEKIYTEPNAILVTGWIEETLAPFLHEKNQKIAFLHIDTDTYKPAIAALNASKNFFVNNSLLLFDDFHSYPNFEMHEFRAFEEFIAQNSDIELFPLAIGPEQMLFRVAVK